MDAKSINHKIAKYESKLSYYRKLKSQSGGAKFQKNDRFYTLGMNGVKQYGTVLYKRDMYGEPPVYKVKYDDPNITEHNGYEELMHHLSEQASLPPQAPVRESRGNCPQFNLGDRVKLVDAGSNPYASPYVETIGTISSFPAGSFYYHDPQNNICGYLVTFNDGRKLEILQNQLVKVEQKPEYRRPEPVQPRQDFMPEYRRPEPVQPRQDFMPEYRRPEPAGFDIPDILSQIEIERLKRVAARTTITQQQPAPAGFDIRPQPRQDFVPEYRRPQPAGFDIPDILSQIEIERLKRVAARNAAASQKY
jgi:hypothetical protein